jgi:hypothetical protein
LHISIFGFLPFFGADANRVASCGDREKKENKKKILDVMAN